MAKAVSLAIHHDEGEHPWSREEADQSCGAEARVRPFVRLFVRSYGRTRFGASVFPPPAANGDSDKCSATRGWRRRRLSSPFVWAMFQTTTGRAARVRGLAGSGKFVLSSGACSSARFCATLPCLATAARARHWLLPTMRISCELACILHAVSSPRVLRSSHLLFGAASRSRYPTTPASIGSRFMAGDFHCTAVFSCIYLSQRVDRPRILPTCPAQEPAAAPRGRSQESF